MLKRRREALNVMRKPTFCQKNTKSEKFAQSRILHSLKALGARIRINLVVLGARTQDSENSGNSDQEIGAFGLKMILRRVFAVENCTKTKKYVIFCYQNQIFCYFGWFWPKTTSERERRNVYTEEVCFDRRWYRHVNFDFG